ncbi:hypothetical protein AA0117_g13291 [Alternaria alternata]|uniref:Uncharacterized protein n=1 Tax=Alternaria alternata TaxID=5599 RepID=A0A4Q4MPH7_ALTAL|nr:hypothetical protein AA0117_g13291 [Alternaria alternata]
MSPGEDDRSDAAARTASLSHSVDAGKLRAKLLETTPRPDDSHEQSNCVAYDQLVQDGNVPCKLKACEPYWNSLKRDYVGVYCAQQSQWQAFRCYQKDQRKQSTMQNLERDMRARRRQHNLPHVNVRLRLEVQRQCRLQTWVEYQDFLLQKQAENTAALKTSTAANTTQSRIEGRLIVMSRCFDEYVLPWTEKVRLGLQASTPNTSVAGRTRNRISKLRVASAKVHQTRQITKRRVRRRPAAASK